MATPPIIATVIHLDSGIYTVRLPLDDDIRLKALQQLVGGYIEGIFLPDIRCIFFNENGKDAPHVINQTATAIARDAEVIQPDDYIAGIAVILPQEIMQ